MSAMPTGTLMKKIQRHPGPSVSRPLAITPTDADVPATAPKIPERAVALLTLRERHGDDRQGGRRNHCSAEP